MLGILRVLVLSEPVSAGAPKSLWLCEPKRVGIPKFLVLKPRAAGQNPRHVCLASSQ